MVPKLTLLCSTNANLLFAVATLIYSVRKTMSRATHLDICCFVDDVPDRDREKLQVFCNGLGNCSLQQIAFDDLAPIAQQQLQYLCQNRPLIWRSAFARLFLIDTLPTQVDRVLYADADIVTLRDISEAATIDLGKSAVGAVEAPQKTMRDRFRGAPYFNSGVLLIDRKKWLAEEITQRCVFWIQHYGRQSKMADQDALNIVLRAADGSPTWQPLSPAWNALPGLYMPLGEIIYDPVPIETVKLLHYAGPEKPWKTQTHPHGHYYREYARKVPFRPGKHAGGLFG